MNLGINSKIIPKIRNTFFYFRDGLKNYTISFYPDYLHSVSALHKICKYNNYKVLYPFDSTADLIFKWNFNDDQSNDNILIDLKHHGKTIYNYNSKPVDKNTVDSVFSEIFGYSSKISEEHMGLVVKKNVKNAAHDGEIIDSLSRMNDKNMIYQKVINNLYDSKLIMDIRAPIMKDKIPFIYLKFRPIENRFSNKNSFVKIEKTDNYLNSREISLILNMSKEFGIDYCEMDILRDKDDDRLYIIDVNPTPSGPPNGLGYKNSQKAIKLLSKSFHQSFILKKK